MVDNIGGAGPAQQMADRKAMDHARGRVKRANRIALDRTPALSSAEAAGGIEQIVLEKREQTIGLAAASGDGRRFRARRISRARDSDILRILRPSVVGPARRTRGEAQRTKFGAAPGKLA